MTQIRTGINIGMMMRKVIFTQVRSQQSAFNELRSSKAAVALSSISSIEQQVSIC